MMTPFIITAQAYACDHKKPMTRILHAIGLSLILLSLMIMLGFIHIVIPRLIDINFATIGTLALLIYYFRLHWRLALALTPIILLLLWISSLFSGAGPTRIGLWGFLLTLVTGCLLQLIGYHIEGKRPALTVASLWQISIAPLVLIADIFFKLGRLRSLQTELYK